MTNRTAVLAVISLIALTGAMGLTGCGGGLDTPEGVTVELLKAKNQYNAEIDTDLLDTTSIPINLRLLIASSEADEGYGLLVTGDADGTAVAGPFPTSAVANQTWYGYRCVSPYPYPIWVAASLSPDPSSGSLSFSKDGERDQYWLAATTGAKIVIVSLTPSGYTVGEPRQFFFNENATISTQLTVQGLPDPSLIVVNQCYYVVIIGNVNWTGFTGATIYTYVNDVQVTIGNLFFVNGQPVIMFNQVLTTFPLTCYFEWNGVVYYFVIGNGGSSTNVKPVASMSLTVNGLTVTGNASGSTDPDGQIVSYNWSWGDGTSSSGATASHTYTTAGTYTITLTITDNLGGITTQTATVVVTGGGSGSGTINVYPEEV